MDKILHLDAGRKYFSLGNIKLILDAMKKSGYNQLQLAFGNDGLRFLLNDMAMDHQTSEAVKEAVKAGNLAYNEDSSFLTEEEMDAILAYAAGLDIEIVPLLNMPGHMNTALYINPSYRWTSEGKVSMNSLAVTDADSVKFGLELLKKYVDYFAQKGCRYFCFGGDEYANDIYNLGGLGFNQLLAEGNYDKFVEFLNRAAQIILDAGMTPRAFNDGFYYNEDINMQINPAIQVYYWGKGWCDFWCAAVDTIASKGHDMINCNGEWYYVLKHEGNVQKPTQHPDFKNFSVQQFPGKQYFAQPEGAMFCIWCDESNLKTNEEVTRDMIQEMEAMAKQLCL
ncbi:MAG: family 20 glycosylhydrolase [Lachnospiraceae bacterium]